MSESAIIDQLVIGGGLAGSMVALRLAQAGHKALIIEREKSAHHKVCGEFLSHEAITYLRGSGIDPIRLGAVPIGMVRLSRGRRVMEVSLPFEALSLSRHVLDEALLQCAEQAGCEVRRGVFVNELKNSGDTWQIACREGIQVSARTVFLATGKHDVAGRPRGRGRQSDLIGFKMHYRLNPRQSQALRSAMELFLFPGGYGGVSLVENGIANLCLVVRQSQLRALGSWGEILASILAQNRLLSERLSGAAPLWQRPLAISPIPYGYMAECRDGLWRIGDQAAVIPSFTGDGMSIALHSGALAAEMYLANQSAREFGEVLEDHLRAGMRRAVWLSRAMTSGLGQIVAPWVVSFCPQAMGRIGQLTRIPEERLLAGREGLADKISASGLFI